MTKPYDPTYTPDYSGIDLSWQDKANCLGLDPNIFFVEMGTLATEAKAVCAGCVVRQDCLEYALRIHQRIGIWGGMTDKERRLWRKAQIREKGRG